MNSEQCQYCRKFVYKGLWETHVQECKIGIGIAAHTKDKR